MTTTATTTAASGAIAEVTEVRVAQPEQIDTQWEMRLARQLVPYPVTALLWAGAAAAHAAGGIAIAGATYLVAAVAWWTVWAKRNPENREARRRYATTITAAGGAWLTWATMAGVPNYTIAALWVGAYAAALPYWRRNTIPIPEDPGLLPPEPAPVLEVVEPERPFVVARWEDVVSIPGGALPGSYLTDHDVTDEGKATYTIQMRLGRETSGSAMAATPRIASAMGMGLGQVSVAYHPSGDMSKAMLTVAMDNPLAKISHYPSPELALDLTKGIRVWMGPRSDDRIAWWDIYREDWGTCGGVVIGGTRSGKSELLKSIITTATYSGLVVPVIADPQGGQSIPEWAKHGHWPATDYDEILRQARAINRALTIRSKINGLRGVKLHAPTKDEPIILWVVDECHEVLHTGGEITAIADRAARLGGKCGIGLIAASQYPGLPTFGNLDSLRNSLLAGNGVALRISSKHAKGMLPGLEVDPSQLPSEFPDGSRTSGLGYTVGPDQVPFRAGLIRKPMELAAAAPKLQIERATASFMGEDYARREIRQLAGRAALAAELEEHDAELVAAITANDPELALMLEAAREVKAERAAAASDTTAPAPVAVTGGVPTLRLVPSPTLNLPQPEQAPTLATAKGTPTAVDVIYDLLGQGVTGKGELIKRSGYSETQVRNSLNALMAQGKVHNPKHGRYERVVA